MMKNRFIFTEGLSVTPKHRQSGRIIIWAGMFILLFASCSAPAAPLPTPTPAGGANSIVISTMTATPASAAPSAEPSMATLAPTGEPRGTVGLPGLAPRNVTVSLEQNQFTCTQVKKGTAYYERTCTRGVPSVQVFQVVISGQTPSVVDHIKASVLQYENPDPEIAIPILSLLAVLPYEGATPEDAKAWVESTIPTLSGESGGVEERRFGGVQYALYGPPTALTLEMGELP